MHASWCFAYKLCSWLTKSISSWNWHSSGCTRHPVLRYNRSYFVPCSSRPPLLTAPFESQQTIMADTDSRTLKKKTSGRWKKHLADVSLMSGLISDALQLYQTAMELLSSSNDQVWLGGESCRWLGLSFAQFFDLNLIVISYLMLHCLLQKADYLCFYFKLYSFKAFKLCLREFKCTSMVVVGILKLDIFLCNFSVEKIFSVSFELVREVGHGWPPLEKPTVAPPAPEKIFHDARPRKCLECWICR